MKFFWNFLLGIFRFLFFLFIGRLSLEDGPMGPLPSPFKQEAKAHEHLVEALDFDS